jgi:pimeloyl-ACP methyl ester carboxylesterase
VVGTLAFLALCAAPRSAAQATVDLDAGCEEWYLPTRDGKCRLYVREVGLGEPIVVLHGGFGAEHGYLLDIAEGLEDRAHFVFYDQRGSLRSPCPLENVAFDAHVDDLERLREELDLERVWIFAHSAGTLLALAYLERHPDRIHALVLAALAQPKSRLEPADFPDGSYPAGFDELPARVREFQGRPEIQGEIEAWGLNKPALSARERTRLWRIQFAGANLAKVENWTRLRGGQVFYSAAAGQAASQSLPQPYDFLPTLRASKVPISILMGDHDFLDFGGIVYPRLFAGAEHIRVIVLEQAGHNAWVDQPDEFRETLASLLRS